MRDRLSFREFAFHHQHGQNQEIETKAKGGTNMPSTLTYPGVYIEEIPSGVRTIAGVATSVAAFMGYFTRGPMNEAKKIYSFADFEREYGGLDSESEASYAIQQFFLNGGTEAWVIRCAKEGTAVAAAIELEDSASGSGATSLLLATAASEGSWGNNLRIDVDYGTTDPSSTFNIIVSEVSIESGKLQVVTSETHRNLTLGESDSKYAVDVVNDGSDLIQLALVGSPSSSQRPAQTGTTSAAIYDAEASTDLLTSVASGDTMDVALNGSPLGTISLDSTPSNITSFANALQSKLRALEDLSRATVSMVGSSSTRLYLQVKAGTTEAGDILTFSGDGSSTDLAKKIGLDSEERSNVQQYELGASAAAGAQALPGGSAQTGDDGDSPDATALIGSEADKTGIYALLDVDLFNILCIPDTMNLGDTEAAQVAATAEEFCADERAFYILDVPQNDSTRDDPDEISSWLDENATLRHKNAALYYPRPMLADSLNDYRLRLVAPSGTIAGLYARTDSTRGVWKAPGGTEATLKGIQDLEYILTDAENGSLNPLGINCFRNFPVYGNVCWGARTLEGSDQQASEWKYIPVRRMALYLEESLYRGTQWVVFELNDEPLWAQIRLNVGAFMHNLFRQGAFQGQTPKEAYFVKCDRETTTQNDIDRGIVNIIVGFAPLKPAEFVVIKLQQMAGQIET